MSDLDTFSMIELAVSRDFEFHWEVLGVVKFYKDGKSWGINSDLKPRQILTAMLDFQEFLDNEKRELTQQNNRV